MRKEKIKELKEIIRYNHKDVEEDSKEWKWLLRKYKKQYNRWNYS